MTYKIFNEMPDDAMMIRKTVFIEEQGFKEEFDEIDKIAKHLIIYHDGKAVGVARYFSEDNPNEYHVGRVAVLKEYRKYGYGKKIMELILKDLKNIGAKTAVLSAQCTAQGFYQKCGFTAVGETYLDEHCPHIKMIKNI